MSHSRFRYFSSFSPWIEWHQNQTKGDTVHVLRLLFGWSQSHCLSCFEKQQCCFGTSRKETVPRVEDVTLPRIHSHVDWMASTVQHRVCARINSLESASSASRAKRPPAVSHLFAQVQSWQKVALLVAGNEAWKWVQSYWNSTFLPVVSLNNDDLMNSFPLVHKV